MLGCESNIPDLILPILKQMLELFAQTTNKSQGLEFIQRRIGRLLEQWQNNQGRVGIFKQLIDLLENLDSAIQAPETYNHTDLLSKSITMVVDLLKKLGAVEIELKENETFNPRRHYAIGVKPSSTVPKGNILQVCRRGFITNSRIYYPEVLVSSGEKEKQYDKPSEPAKNQSNAKQIDKRHAKKNQSHRLVSGCMFDVSCFFPSDFKVDTIIYDMEEIVVIEIRSCQDCSDCPICSTKCTRKHSSYSRNPMDLPILGKTVRLKLTCRKFFCDNHDCVRTVFTERFKDFIKSYARKTQRLKDALTTLAFSSNAKTNSSVAKKLSFAASANTFLRIIRNTPTVVNEKADMIGIDDFAFKKGNNYGTIVCDLKTHRPIDLLPEREGDTVEQWLQGRNKVELVTRDRSGAYKKALDKACPEAIQVADRFHISKNLLDGIKGYVRRTYNPKIFIGWKDAEKIVKKKLIVAKYGKSEKANHQKKRQLIRQVKSLYAQGKKIRELSRITGLSRETIRKYITYHEDKIVICKRSPAPSKLDRFSQLIRELVANNQSAAEIFRFLKGKGYQGSASLLRKYVHTIKQQTQQIPDTGKDQAKRKKKYITRNKMVGYLWKLEENLDSKGRSILEQILQQFQQLRPVYNLIQKFRCSVLNRDLDQFKLWLEEALELGIAELTTFVQGVKMEPQSVYNALLYEYSNGVVEGNVNRLKMLKRLMYGRAKFDLLRKRVLYHPN